MLGEWRRSTGRVNHRSGLVFISSVEWLLCLPPATWWLLEQSSNACSLAENRAVQLSITFVCHRPIVPVQMKLRTFGESVEIDVSVMRPGQGLNFVVGMVVEGVSPAGDRRTEVKNGIDPFR